MIAQKNTTVTTCKYDEYGNIIETKVVEETEIPEADPILCGFELEDDECEAPCFDGELTIENSTSIVDVIFGIAGVMSVVASALSIRKLLKQ